MDWFKSSRKKESKNYEKEYLTRYNKQRKDKRKDKKPSRKKIIEIESDKKSQDVGVETQKKESEPLSTKFESVKQEYNSTIKNLMDTKKVLNGIKEDIKKAINE